MQDGSYEGNGLNSLAQTHVISQDGTSILSVPTVQKLDSLPLVGPQVLVDRARHLKCQRCFNDEQVLSNCIPSHPVAQLVERWTSGSESQGLRRSGA